MIRRKAYTIISLAWRVLPVTFLFLSGLLCSTPLNAQEESLYDEISIFLEFTGVGGSEIPAVIKGEELYLPVTVLFDLFRIKNVPEPGLGTISGFFNNPEDKFVISRENNQINYLDRTYNLNEGSIIRTENDLFLHSDLYGKIFGLDCFFNFRSLSVKVNSKLELPMIREMRQEEMRKNLSRLKGEMVTDTIIKRTYPVFRFGMADWSVFADQDLKGKDNTRLNLSLGAMIAGGEATASTYYNSGIPFSWHQQNILWRYVDNDYSLFRQISLGTLITQSTSSLFNPVLGVQLTNTPTTYRRSFGTYSIVDRTEPGWVVELYVNNVLVDYIKADGSGFFKFDVPLVYGNSIIHLKFFGPWGEEKVREQNISIPYNFIPENSFEYKFTAGVVEDSSFSRYSRLNMNYGVSRKLTVGGGIEYLSSVINSPVMPFLNVSWSILNNLLVSGEYTHGVRSKGTINYRLPSNIEIEANYIKYVPGQKAIIYNYLEERKASVSLPFRLKNFSAYSRLSLNQLVLPSIRYSQGELISTTTRYSTASWMFSGSFPGINANLTTNANLLENQKPTIYSNLTFSIRAPGNFIFIPQIQYGFTRKELISSRLGIEKRIGERAFMNASIDRNFINDLTMAELGFRYNFNFGQVGASVRQGRNSTSFVEYARGSLIHDSKTRYLGFDNKNNVGRGGISLIPYIDINANGRRDPREPGVYGLNIKSTGGYVEKGGRDTTVRILGLEPYTRCFIELDPNSFENISWRLPVKSLGVAVDPEILKHIEIPVVVLGEASGTVTLENDGRGQDGVGRMIVTFFNRADLKAAGSTLTEDDGYFTLFGLTPGDYFAKIDTSQLRKLNMSSDPVIREFSIKAGMDGDYVDGLDFRLKMIESDTIMPEVKKPGPVTRKDTSIMVIHEVFEELVTITKDSWAIQLGAFKNRTNADNLRKNLEKILGRKVDIVIADGYFKVRINEIEQRSEVDQIVEILRRNGITELWIISQRAKQQQIVLREVSDSVIKIVETRVDEPEMFESKIFLPFGEEFYKLDRQTVPITDQTMMDLMKSHSTLDKMKLKDIRPNVRIIRRDTVEIIIPGVKGDELKKAGTAIPVRDEIKIDKIVLPFNAPALTKPVEKSVSKETAPEEVKVPVISLQVAIFYKKSEAVKAQKKIMSKLNLPVKIVEQWEYFRVIITGFHSREETFQYYPELAGLGYPGPTLIEE